MQAIVFRSDFNLQGKCYITCTFSGPRSPKALSFSIFSPRIRSPVRLRCVWRRYRWFTGLFSTHAATCGASGAVRSVGVSRAPASPLDGPAPPKYRAFQSFRVGLSIEIEFIKLLCVRRKTKNLTTFKNGTKANELWNLELESEGGRCQWRGWIRDVKVAGPSSAITPNSKRNLGMFSTQKRCVGSKWNLKFSRK